MSSPFNEDEYRWLVRFLANLSDFLTPSSQRGFIRTAFFGSPKLSDISARLEYSESPRRFVISALEFFLFQVKEDIPGRKTISVFLREVVNSIGEGEESQKLSEMLVHYYQSNQISAAVTVQTQESTLADLTTQLTELQNRLADMDQTWRTELNLLLWEVAQTQESTAEVNQSAHDLQSWADKILTTSNELNAQLRQDIQHLTEHSSNVNQYLLATLPIIPGILSYNVELGTEHAQNLRNIWKRMLQKFRPSLQVDTSADSTTKKGITDPIHSYAILIGINSYPKNSGLSSLEYCTQDLTELNLLLANKYTKTSFIGDNSKVLPIRDNICNEMTTQAKMVGDKDLLLFYFSGHGIVEDGKSYLLPNDTNLARLKETAISIEWVLETMNKSLARAKVLIIDACHSGAQIGKSSVHMTSEFLNQAYENAAGTAILAACKQGQRSWESPVLGHGAYTYYLLEALSGRADFTGKGFVTVTDAHQYVSGMVKMWATKNQRAQNPTLEYKVDGDILLYRYNAKK